MLSMDGICLNGKTCSVCVNIFLQAARVAINDLLVLLKRVCVLTVMYSASEVTCACAKPSCAVTRFYKTKQATEARQARYLRHCVTASSVCQEHHCFALCLVI